MPEKRTGAQRYFEQRAKSSEFRREYDDARQHIDAIDRFIHDLDEARTRAGLSKAELARRARMAPEVVRRIFTAKHANPTLDTLVRLAHAADVDLKLTTFRTPARRSTVTSSAARRSRPRRSASA